MTENFKWDYDSKSKTLRIDSTQMPNFLLKTVERNGALESIGMEEMRASLPWGNFADDIEIIDAPNLLSITPVAFAWLPNLTVVDASSALVIDNSAFYTCPNLQIALIQNVQVIGNSAFARCTALERTSSKGRSWVELRNCRLVSAFAFQSCKSLTTVTFKKKGSRTADDGHVIQESGTALEFIGEAAFAGCSKLKSVALGGKDSGVVLAKNVFYKTKLDKSAENATASTVDE